MVILQAALMGLLTGGVYCLMAAGFNLALGVLRVLNFAHGELTVLGGYIAYTLFRQLGWGPLQSLLPVMAFTFLFGAFLHRVLIQRISSASELTVVLATFGLALILTDLMAQIFTLTSRFIPTFSGTVQLGPLSLPAPRLVAFSLSVLITAGVWLFLHRSRFGKCIRAVSQHQVLAHVCGVRVLRVQLVAFAISVMLAGAAGSLLVTMYPINPETGDRFLLQILAIAVVGGLGSFPGALVGAAILGVVEALVATLVSARLGVLVFYLSLVLILLLRPQGLWGIRHVAGR